MRYLNLRFCKAILPLILIAIAPPALSQWQTFAAPWPLVSTYFGHDAFAFAVVDKPATGERILFAGGGTGEASGLFRSDDGGRSWSRLELKLEDGSPATQAAYWPIWAGTLPSPSANPVESDELYVSIHLGATGALGNSRCDLLRSRDLGATWTVVLRNIPVCLITIDTSAAPVMYGIDVGYAASFVSGIYRSRDRGASWQTTSYVGGPPTLRVGPDGTLYAVAGLIHVSSNQGDTWKTIGENDASFGAALKRARDVVAWRDPLQSGVGLVVSTPDGLYKSIDGGATWSAAGLQGFSVGSLDLAHESAGTSTTHPKIRIAFGPDVSGLDHSGLALLQSGAVLPLTAGLPPTDGAYVLKGGRYALSNGALSVCADTSSCVGGDLPRIETLVEFHNSLLDHYFMTVDDDEAAGIDRGEAGPGWSRTGQTFRVYGTVRGTPRPATPVCRFYGTPRLGPNSHFFSADPAECAQVSSDDRWTLETPAAFAALRPERRCQASIAGGQVCGPACPAGKLVYRLYNGGFPTRDSNHRYVSDVALYQAMQSQGWIGEDTRMCTAQ